MIVVYWLLFFKFILGKLHIWSPASLAAAYRKQPLEYTIADLGDVPYGKSIIGRLTQATPFDLCTNKDGYSLDKKENESVFLLA